jgi:hypothetical protein
MMWVVHYAGNGSNHQQPLSASDALDRLKRLVSRQWCCTAVTVILVCRIKFQAFTHVTVACVLQVP